MRPAFPRTWVEIDAAALRHNVAEFRKLIGPKVSLMAVVKSNAYGHGLVQVAKQLASYRPPAPSNQLWFGVDSIVEALRLRREGIKNPILVLGYTLPHRLQEAARQRITVTVSHFEGLALLAKLHKPPAFHLKLDTGMHRQGFQEYEILELIAALKRYRLVPAGVYSHFAAAENRKFSQKQIAVFGRCLAMLRLAGIRPGIRHLAATGGTRYYPKAHYDMVRIGLGLYGYLPSRDTRYVARIRVRPVMTWKTIVGEVKQVKKGEGIGYDLTERFRRDSTIAILPIGYWHGFDRGLSSTGELLIHGRRCKVMGRVSMDMTCVDITDINGNPKPETRNSKVRIGDEVVIVGRQGREFIGANEMAEKIGTTAYEVLTRVNPLIRRVVR